jgi:hypothetical protein
MKIALVLSTAFVTTAPGAPDRERRIRQYVNGFDQVAAMCARHPGFDVYSVDNTVEDGSVLDKKLMTAIDAITSLKGRIHFSDNETGRINKGSGLVVQWGRILPDLAGKYDYTVHYEPRQHLVDFSYFERMEQRPDAYICPYRDKVKLYGVVPLTLHRFWTGFFSLRTSDLLDYVRSPDRRVLNTISQYRRWPYYRYARQHILPGWLAEMNECIESDLPRYVRRHRIQFQAVKDLGTRWHEEATGNWVDMRDRLFVS